MWYIYNEGGERDDSPSPPGGEELLFCSCPDLVLPSAPNPQRWVLTLAPSLSCQSFKCSRIVFLLQVQLHVLVPC